MLPAVSHATGSHAVTRPYLPNALLQRCLPVPSYLARKVEPFAGTRKPPPKSVGYEKFPESTMLPEGSKATPPAHAKPLNVLLKTWPPAALNRATNSDSFDEPTRGPPPKSIVP